MGDASEEPAWSADGSVGFIFEATELRRFSVKQCLREIDGPSAGAPPEAERFE